MFTSAVHCETIIDSFSCRGISFEVLQCPATIWCGTLGYATDCNSEPDIEGLILKYQSQCDIPKAELAAPDWSCCISIDYWRDGAVPRGIMFAQQVLTDAQDVRHDVFRMPASLYVRAACTSENAMAAFGRESCDPHELFGVIREAMLSNGYRMGGNGAQEIEMYSSGGIFAYVQAENAD